MFIPTTGAVYRELRCNSDANKLSSLIYMLLCAAHCRLMKLHTVAPLFYPVTMGFYFDGNIVLYWLIKKFNSIYFPWIRNTWIMLAKLNFITVWSCNYLSGLYYSCSTITSIYWFPSIHPCKFWDSTCIEQAKTVFCHQSSYHPTRHIYSNVLTSS
jgi:hypothetical protein